MKRMASIIFLLPTSFCVPVRLSFLSGQGGYFTFLSDSNLGRGMRTSVSMVVLEIISLDSQISQGL